MTYRYSIASALLKACLIPDSSINIFHHLNKTSLNIITLGCSKNTVDSEHLAGRLDPAIFEIMHDSVHPSDVVLINTCGFIGDAREESVDTILSFAQARKQKQIRKLIVMGCLVERYKNQLVREIHEVDAFMGLNDTNAIVELLQQEAGTRNQTVANDSYHYKRSRATAEHFAYLKISEGCDRTCSFCSIPLIRGKHRSTPMDALVKEAEYLAKTGVKELILIAQDLTYYGIDLYGKQRITELADNLTKVGGIEWVRLQYGYPHRFPASLTALIENNPKICRYIDLPLQHISDRILLSMRRGLDKAGTIRLVDDIRNSVPGIAFRTTFIVGYPGESQEEFDELYDFVARQKFERLGVFGYSAEEGTAAHKLPDDVPQEVKQQRIDTLMELQEGISFALNRKKTGTIHKVLIDRAEGDYFIGRTQFDSPEVDNEVLIERRWDLICGRFYDIRITGAEPFDLYGEPV